MLIFLAVLASYLIGAIPFSLIFGIIYRGIDVRRTGSGNVGATNTLVTAGKRAGIAAVFFDIAKGFAAVVLSQFLVGGEIIAVLCAISAIIGHNYSLYLGFKGGKGIATTSGAIAALNPYLMLPILMIYVIFLIITRYLILSTLLTLVLLPFIFILAGDGMVYSMYGILSFGLAIVAHRKDIERLVAGQEKKLSEIL